MSEEIKEPEFLEPEFEATDAHPFDENPEDHIGKELPDPWTDPNADEAWRIKQADPS